MNGKIGDRSIIEKNKKVFSVVLIVKTEDKNRKINEEMFLI